MSVSPQELAAMKPSPRVMYLPSTPGEAGRNGPAGIGPPRSDMERVTRQSTTPGWLTPARRIEAPEELFPEPIDIANLETPDQIVQRGRVPEIASAFLGIRRSINQIRLNRA